MSKQRVKLKANYYVFSRLFLCLFGVVLLSCSTKKAGFVNKLYHNTTAHYNVWWNGKQSFEEAIVTLEKSVKDDYTNILPVYKLGSNQDALLVAPQLDRAVEKGNKGINKHSINIKGKEHVQYIAYCYLLITKAQFYKQEYSAAAFTAQYLINQFPTKEQAYEGMIWYARSMMKQKEYFSAETVLDKVRVSIETGQAPKKLKSFLYASYSENALAQEKYKLAAEHLKLAIEYTHNKKLEARLNFILGQIYQSQDKLSTASKYYTLALRSTSDYEMIFNTKLNLASCFTAKNTDNKKVLEQLYAMLKDKKNEEYADQIYYAIGEVYYSSKDPNAAVDAWKKSVEVSSANLAQKIKSALRLANTYSDVFQDYVKAYQYYDTLVTILPPEASNYARVTDQHKILKDLSENISIIERADSLLSYSRMSVEEQNERIDKIIEREKKKEQEELLKVEEVQNKQIVSKASIPKLKGNWYFYNEGTVKQGKTAFMKVWGKRELKDNWFLAGTQTFFTEEVQRTEQVGADPSATADLQSAKMGRMPDSSTKQDGQSLKQDNDPQSRAYYLKDVPKSEEERRKLQEQLPPALLLLGFLYREGIQNEPKALECFHRLIDEFQETDYALPAFYQLYLIYEREGNTPNSNYFKNMILKGFPDSDYANLIRDRKHYQVIKEREKAPGRAYALVYEAFIDRNYEEVLSLADEFVQNYTDSNYMAKSLYWKALALGKLGYNEKMIGELETVLENYPQSEIQLLIQKQLVLLRSTEFVSVFSSKSVVDSVLAADSTQDVVQNGTVETPNPREVSLAHYEDLPPESELYRFRNNVEHYVVIIVKATKIDATQLSYSISDINQLYFSSIQLNSRLLMFSESLEMISVERFTDAKKAMEYYQFIQKADGPLREFDPKDYYVFPVSIQNFMTFYKQKNLEAYDKFFRKYYF